MHLHFEKDNNAKCDCNILSLSWMGKVPDESLEVGDSLQGYQSTQVLLKHRSNRY